MESMISRCFNSAKSAVIIFILVLIVSLPQLIKSFKITSNTFRNR